MDPGITWISRQTRIAGRVDTDGSVRIDGRIEGMIHAGENVIVGASGVVVTEIHAQQADILGVVIGNVVATHRIDVRAGARVVGDLRAPEVELAAGATIEGRVDRDAPRAPEPPPRERPTLRSRAPLRRPTRPGAPPPDELETTTPGSRAVPTEPAPPPGAPRFPRLSSRARLIPRRANKGEP